MDVNVGSYKFGKGLKKKILRKYLPNIHRNQNFICSILFFSLMCFKHLEQYLAHNKCSRSWTTKMVTAAHKKWEFWKEHTPLRKISQVNNSAGIKIFHFLTVSEEAVLRKGGHGICGTRRCTWTVKSLCRNHFSCHFIIMVGRSGLKTGVCCFPIKRVAQSLIQVLAKREPFVSSGSWNKTPHTGCLEQHKYICHSSEKLRSPRPGCQQIKYLVCKWFADGCLLTVSSHREEQVEEASSLLSLLVGHQSHC